MKIRTAGKEDLALLGRYDRHISREELLHSLSQGRVYLAEEDGRFLGWLRYGLFWDSVPFLNLLYLLEGERGKGYGRALVGFWEERMKSLRYPCVMTSTASDEYAQHFYVKLGYRAVGGFQYRADPYEIILTKELSDVKP